MANNPATRMNNRKAPDTVGRPHDDGSHAQKAQQHSPSPKDLPTAIEAAEHGGDNRKPDAPSGRH